MEYIMKTRFRTKTKTKLTDRIKRFAENVILLRNNCFHR